MQRPCRLAQARKACHKRLSPAPFCSRRPSPRQSRARMATAPPTARPLPSTTAIATASSLALTLRCGKSTARVSGWAVGSAKVPALTAVSVGRPTLLLSASPVPAPSIIHIVITPQRVITAPPQRPEQVEASHNDRAGMAASMKRRLYAIFYFYVVLMFLAASCHGPAEGTEQHQAQLWRLRPCLAHVRPWLLHVWAAKNAGFPCAPERLTFVPHALYLTVPASPTIRR